MPPKTKKPKFQMTDEHKDALALGRQQGRIVGRYLEAIDSGKGRRGPKQTVESIQERIAELDAEMAAADPLTRVKLVQQRLDLKRELASLKDEPDLDELEEEFVQVAADYGHRKGVTWAAWRECGVDAAVLKRAGIPRTD